MQLLRTAPEGSLRRRASRSTSLLCLLVFAGWAATSIQHELAGLTAASDAQATATTGPCEVGVELRLFPGRFVGYTSYVCPSDASAVQVRFRLRGFAKAGADGSKATYLSGWSPWSTVGASPQDTPTVSSAVVYPREPDGLVEYQLQTETSYSEDGQGYTQAVVSRRVPLP